MKLDLYDEGDGWICDVSGELMCTDYRAFTSSREESRVDMLNHLKAIYQEIGKLLKEEGVTLE